MSDKNADRGPPTASTATTTAATKRVVVVGTGFAGLGVAYHLLKDQQRRNSDDGDGAFRWEVRILEARNRIGGRVCTHSLGGGACSADGDGDGGGGAVRVELGGQWVHESSSSNPIPRLMEELGVEFRGDPRGEKKKSRRRRRDAVFDAATGKEIDRGACRAASRLFDDALDNFDPDRVDVRTSLQDLLDRRLEARERRRQEEQQQQRRRRRSSGAASSDRKFAVALNHLRHRTECYEGGRLSELSASLSDLYVNRGGPDRTVEGGYGRLLEALAERVGRDKIRLNCGAASIEYRPRSPGEEEERDGGDAEANGENPTTPSSSPVVRIGLAGSEAGGTGGGGTAFLTADYCVCTVPLGVLRRRDGIRFVPDLPDPHKRAIRSMGMGLLNKIVLRFDRSFWGDLDRFGAADADDPSLTKTFFDCTDRRGPFGGEGAAVLMVFLGGSAARRIDYYTDDDDDDTAKTSTGGDAARGLTDEQAVEDAMVTLRRIFGNDAVPDPVATKVTRWMADPFARGAYSFAKVGCTADAYDKVSEPIGNLLFAGEHTSRDAHSTVHGAWETGEREAKRLIGWVGGTTRS